MAITKSKIINKSAGVVGFLVMVLSVIYDAVDYFIMVSVPVIILYAFFGLLQYQRKGEVPPKLELFALALTKSGAMFLSWTVLVLMLLGYVAVLFVKLLPSLG